MHPVQYYDSLRQGREELLRQAAQQRQARQVVYKHWWQKLFQIERRNKLQLKQVKGV